MPDWQTKTLDRQKRLGPRIQRFRYCRLALFALATRPELAVCSHASPGQGSESSSRPRPHSSMHVHGAHASTDTVDLRAAGGVICSEEMR